LAVLVERVLRAHLILSNEAAAAAVEANQLHPARVVQVVAEQVLPTTLITGLMEPQILAVAEAEAQTAQLRQRPVKMAALGLFKFVIWMRLRQPHQLQAHLQLQCRAGIVFTHLPLLVQSHSEAQHESFCKSRKRHRHTSYCGGARRY
jgi:hypothetical protein